MKHYYFDFPSLGQQEGEKPDSFDFSKEIRAALDHVSKRINAEVQGGIDMKKPEIETQQSADGHGDQASASVEGEAAAIVERERS
ncbi:hypothetical protein AC578_5528 [Pseudocercospora eumusae]|uniref:Uncharacterized protein n=1 Tax=Pseudocercospora eumusae TaxID=321146 RepID=A0A139H7T4_9PEZI|nr:hypothetical protein AC578_5528 [Pseudocercospora eumusae]